MTERVNLLGLTQSQMIDFVAEHLGEKKFRARQIFKWIHQYGVDNFDAMTNLGKPLRARLAEVAEIRAPEVLFQGDSSDGTRKFVLKLDGGNAVETIYIPDGRRGTLCVSSQVGCSLDCSFCSTGKQGFNRNLSTAEIIGQVWIAAKSYGLPILDTAERRVTNVVMMGMGEPLLNFDPVVDSMHMMMDDDGYGISKRRVTLSTSGVVPAMDKLRTLTDVSLAVSLHAPDDELRNQLVPINKKYNIATLMAATQRYLDSLPDNRSVTFEYTMLDGINDRPEQARDLANLIKKHGIRCKVNLIPFNPFPGTNYKTSPRPAILAFQKRLVDANIITTVRTTRGDDIDAACGQLVGTVMDRTKRSERYIKLQQVQ
ncbi:23S rRNA (adenine(2503)-C(2))-methyltransferase RlmN [Litorivicinus lipolyticus]|uniref:Dual-specificity RNA methyltransferase RlmN n=1 Tax=Litorivicinus lipolyticus TaxID=418701 RepID=A0A5Q2Q748_9GAMM|nr:23S rRNA (adenine(2503)-C(2))-methyltransferase RlmN [Litorivicinus lipolyticus]QGG79718.1 23S rRNA (adenine(2503)-C(2))-methyltransferase RlmN [Litorivicinus lipolyticus]